MIVRPFRLSDALPILELWEQVLPQTTEALELLSEQLSYDSDLVLVAESDDDRLVGVIVGGVSDNEALVHRIAVTPSHRGKGIGKLLMKELTHRCQMRGIQSVCCAIDPFNQLALPFYRAMGLKERVSVKSIS